MNPKTRKIRYCSASIEWIEFHCKFSNLCQDISSSGLMPGDGQFCNLGSGLSCRKDMPRILSRMMGRLHFGDRNLSRIGCKLIENMLSSLDPHILGKYFLKDSNYLSIESIETQSCRMHSHSGLSRRFGTSLWGNRGRSRSHRWHRLRNSSSQDSHSELRGRGGKLRLRPGRTRRSRASRRERRNTFCSRSEW